MERGGQAGGAAADDQGVVEVGHEFLGRDQEPTISPARAIRRPRIRRERPGASRDRRPCWRVAGELVVGPAVELPAGLRLLPSSPLLEEEGDARLPALVADLDAPTPPPGAARRGRSRRRRSPSRSRPGRCCRGLRAAARSERNRTAAGAARRWSMRGRPCLRFSTLTPHQMCGSRPRPRSSEPQQVAHPFGALGRAPGRCASSRVCMTRDDRVDVLVGHVLVEQVAHRVDEDHPRTGASGGARRASRARAGGRTPARRDGPARRGTARRTSRRSSGRSPGLILVQPRTGFQVASVHSMLEWSLIARSSYGPRSLCRTSRPASAHPFPADPLLDPPVGIVGLVDIRNGLAETGEVVELPLFNGFTDTVFRHDLDRAAGHAVLAHGGDMSNQLRIISSDISSAIAVAFRMQSGTETPAEEVAAEAQAGEGALDLPRPLDEAAVAQLVLRDCPRPAADEPEGGLARAAQGAAQLADDRRGDPVLVPSQRARDRSGRRRRRRARRAPREPGRGRSGRGRGSPAAGAPPCAAPGTRSRREGGPRPPGASRARRRRRRRRGSRRREARAGSGLFEQTGRGVGRHGQHHPLRLDRSGGGLDAEAARRCGSPSGGDAGADVADLRASLRGSSSSPSRKEIMAPPGAGPLRRANAPRIRLPCSLFQAVDLRHRPAHRQPLRIAGIDARDERTDGVVEERRAEAAADELRDALLDAAGRPADPGLAQQPELGAQRRRAEC